MDPVQNSSPGRRRRRFWRLLALLVVIAAVVTLVSFAKHLGWLAGGTMPDRKLHQAVFLTNGQVYFGKMDAKGREIVLTDVYYLQVTQPLQQQSTAQTQQNQQQPQVNLVKMGTEIHGPTDKMVIPKDNVLFWEDIKSDAVIAKAITEYKNKQGQ